jgi:adenosylcobinamide-phosphate synthase
MESIYILILALLIDISLGDPPDRLHPVAWLGKLIHFESKSAVCRTPKSQFIMGMLLVLLTTSILGTITFFFLDFLADVNSILYVIAGALLLKSTFSVRGLLKAASRIKQELQKNKIESARQDLKWLVSRDTSNLDRNQAISAAIESVAENICDSFVAPVIYFLAFGITGAVVYRIVNTFDAMIGYHGNWEYFGKFAARLDDVLNFIPARISAFLLVIAAPVVAKNMAKSYAIMLRDHGKTESPNAGWTMSAVAGALDIRLEKPGCYQLGDQGHPLSLSDIDASVKIASATVAFWSAISLAIQGVIIATT